MTKVKALSIYIQDKELQDRIVERCTECHIFFRLLKNVENLPSAGAVLTDTEVSVKGRSNVWFLLMPEEAKSRLNSLIDSGYRHFIFRHPDMLIEEFDVLFWNVDAARTDRKTRIKDYKPIPDKCCYRSEYFTFNFHDAKVIRNETEREIYVTHAQLVYLYNRLVKKDVTRGRSTGTPLIKAYTKNIFSPVRLYEQDRCQETVSEQ